MPEPPPDPKPHEHPYKKGAGRRAPGAAANSMPAQSSRHATPPLISVFCENPKSKIRDLKSVPAAPCAPHPAPSLPYAELHCLSNFSFLRGASHPEELVQRAAELGYEAIAITDRNSLAGVVRAHVALKQLIEESDEATPRPSSRQAPAQRHEGEGAGRREQGAETPLNPKSEISNFKSQLANDRPTHSSIENRKSKIPRLIIGAEITPRDAPPVVLLAPDRNAYARLARLLTRGKLRAPKGECELYLRDIAELGEGAGWIGIVTERHGGTKAQRHGGEEEVLSPESFPSCLRASVPSCLAEYRTIFGRTNLFLALELNRETPDEQHIARMAAISAQTGIPLLACNDVHYHAPQRRFLQNILTCIREKCTIHNAGRRLLANAERHLRPRDEITRRYTALTDPRLAEIGRAAVARSVAIAGRCTFSLDELRYDYPHELVPEGMTAMEYLEERTWLGALEVYRHVNGRHEGTEARRHEGEGSGIRAISTPGSEQGEQDEGQQDQNIPRLDCLAEGDGLGRAGLSDNESNSGFGAVRPDQPDAPSNGIRAFQHRRGLRAPESDGLCAIPQDRPRLVGRASNSNDPVGKAAIHSDSDNPQQFARRNRPRPPGADSQLGSKKIRRDGTASEKHEGTQARRHEEKGSGLRTPGSAPHFFVPSCLRASEPSSSPPCLRAFVPSCLCSTVPENIRNLIAAELNLIRRLKYEHYFLTVFDITRYARSRGILCQGRGSAANSAVCYCLGITSVDPAKHDLLFERFMSEERNEPPDIDVDFEHERREEVFQYIYEKYGRERAAITGVVTSYRRRSAVRDVGKALGLSLDCVDALAKSLDWFDAEPLASGLLRNVGVDPNDRTIKMLVRLVKQLVGFPRHLSQHVGGFVITENPLCEIVPLETSPMPGRTFIEWDKDDIDALGILKVDCLALGMLTAISKCFKLLGRHEGTEARRHEGKGSGFRVQGMASHSPPFVPSCLRAYAPSSSCLRASVPSCLLDLPQEDPAVYDMICHADTIGVFQIESRAQMSMLPRLRPRNFYDLVIEVAIVRPGPIQGGMVHPYLRRRDKLEPVEYPSKAVERVLKKTLGVPLFQEQVMRMAVVAAGFTPGEADQLRRAMAAWRRNGSIGKFEGKLIRGMLARGYTKQFAEQIYKQICGFGEYGFPESHAASFALLVYASAWLKRYHPAAYCAAMINAYPLGFYTPGQLIRDAIEHGVEVRGVDVNFSDWDCTLEEGAGRGAQGAGGHNQSEPEAQARIPVAAAPRGGRRIDENPRDAKTPPAPSVPRPPGPSPAPCALRPAPSPDWGRHGPALRLGFRLIRGLSEEKIQGILAARQREGAGSGEQGAEGWRACCSEQACSENNHMPAQGSRHAARAHGSQTSNLQSEISNPKSEIQNSQSAIYNPQSSSSPPCSPLPAPRSLPITSIHQLARHGVSRETLLRLAAADAFRSLGLSRREALWRILLLDSDEVTKRRSDEVEESNEITEIRSNAVKSSDSPSLRHSVTSSLFRNLEPDEPPVTLPKMSMAETVAQDYESTGFSLNAHPMELVREDLERHEGTKARRHEEEEAGSREQGTGSRQSGNRKSKIENRHSPRVLRNIALRTSRNGQRVAVAGLVTCRQRPGTASGIVFMTLEDETAMANLVVKPEVYQRYRAIARGKTALIAEGRVQRVGEVIHVMVERLFDLTETIGRLRTRSRDFH